MNIKYFSDTRTVFVEFSDNEVVETKEINENVYVDVDRFGKLVAMTIEHAQEFPGSGSLQSSGGIKPGGLPPGSMR
jgi:uncharacterized protein YuzE